LRVKEALIFSSSTLATNTKYHFAKPWITANHIIKVERNLTWPYRYRARC